MLSDECCPMTVAEVPGIHPPRHEARDVTRRLYHNCAGEWLPLEACEVTDFGLYTKRRFVRPHERLAGTTCWMLPTLGLRVISWIPRPGVEDLEDYYIDMAAITVDDGVWRMVDHYLDIVVWTGHRAEVLDQDEFVVAVLAGHLDAGTAEGALAAGYRVLEGLAAHGYDLDRWLRTAYGIELSWP
jgi:predicted RNA-binding protein associated with RNAse of E/G family